MALNITQELLILSDKFHLIVKLFFRMKVFFLAFVIFHGCTLSFARAFVPPYTKDHIFITLPLLFKDYNQLIKNYQGSKYLYPGSFTMDKENIYLQYVFEPKQKDNVIVWYDSKGNYKGYFLIDNGGKGNAGEGLAIVRKNKCVSEVYAASNNGTLIGYRLKHDSPTVRLERFNEKQVGVYNQFSYRKGRWLIEHYDTDRSIYAQRTDLRITDNDFNILHNIKTFLEYSGYITSRSSSDAAMYNKRQGLALGDIYYAASYGGFYFSKLTPTKNTYQGIRVFNLYGDLIFEKIIEPSVLINTLSNIGYHVSRIENEGIFISSDNRIIYSLYVYSDRSHKEISTKEGVLILMDRFE